MGSGQNIYWGEEEEVAFRRAYDLKKLTKTEFVRQAIRYYAEKTSPVPEALREYLEQQFATLRPTSTMQTERILEVCEMYTRVFVGAHNIHYLCRVHIPMGKNHFTDRDQAITKGIFKGNWRKLNQAMFRVLLQDEIEISSFFLNFLKIVDKYEDATTLEERAFIYRSHTFFLNNMLATISALEHAVDTWRRATGLIIHPSFVR